MSTGRVDLRIWPGRKFWNFSFVCSKNLRIYANVEKFFLVLDAFMGMNRRIIAIMFVCLSGTGMHCDRMVTLERI